MNTKLFIFFIILVLAGVAAYFAVSKIQEGVGSELGKTDLIKINNPRQNQAIESPLLVKGEARGYWFFEASFPVKIFDNNNFLLSIVPAQALGKAS